MNRKTLRMIGLALLCAGPVAAQVIVSDGFNDSTIDPAWTLVYRDNGANFVGAESGGVLSVTSVSDTISSNAVWGVAALRRTFAPVTGDFSAAISFNWSQATGIQAMDGISFRLLDGANNVIGAVGYLDAWVGDQGAYTANAAGSGGGTARGTLPFTGSLDGLITRSASSVTTYRNSVAVAIGTSTAAVEALELEFWFYAYPGSYFGTINVDSVSFAAVPEPSTYAALAGAGVLGIALFRRRNSRS